MLFFYLAYLSIELKSLNNCLLSRNHEMSVKTLVDHFFFLIIGKGRKLIQLV